MKVKVCGMKYVENIISVAGLLPDYMGFIFYEKSKRNFEGNIPEIDKTIKKVGVFVNASFQQILDTVSAVPLDIVQLHGDETVAGIWIGNIDCAEIEVAGHVVGNDEVRCQSTAVARVGVKQRNCNLRVERCTGATIAIKQCEANGPRGRVGIQRVCICVGSGYFRKALNIGVVRAKKSLVVITETYSRYTRGDSNDNYAHKQGQRYWAAQK